jgi:hypothetical protein
LIPEPISRSSRYLRLHPPEIEVLEARQLLGLPIMQLYIGT